MYHRLLYTLAIAVSLTGLYAMYSVAMQTVVVIPIRTEQPVEVDAMGEPQWPAENVRVAKQYITHRKWAEKSSYMLRAEQAFIYTKHWEPVAENNKQIRFDKFALAWTSIDKEGLEQAVTIVSDHALLEFASAFDEKATFGRVVRAVLEGDVVIQGPDGLSVIGRNFIFDESELNLYTLNPVSFRFQSHHGSASRMAIKLIPAEGLPGKDRPHVYGVESIHLMANPSLPKNPHVILEVQMPQGDELKTVKVKCAGDMEYSVVTNTAILTKDVIVWTGSEDNRDRLDCYKLTMQFVPKKLEVDELAAETKHKSDDEKRRENEYQHLDRDLEFSWLLAESQFEAERRNGQLVIVASKSQKVNASMGRLTYSAETRVLSMSSHEIKPRSNDREPCVHVTQNGSELVVPTIEAQLGESSARQFRLTSLICRGAGKLTFVDEKTGKLAFSATWQKQLSKKTDAETQLDLVELEESAHFGTDQGTTGLIADLIKIWIVPFNISTPTNGNERSAESPRPEPKRLLALHGVALQSPALRIERTNELDIRFEDPDETTVNASRKFRSNLRPVSLTTHESRPIGFASIPTTSGGTRGLRVEIPRSSDPAPRSGKTAKQLVKPIVVSADRIRVRMRQIEGKEEPEVLAVHAEGRVTISQEQAPGEKPTTLDGDRVDLKNQSANHQVIDVFGSPAKIRDQRFKIDGKEIHLDRGGNRAWVSGSGWLQLPIPKKVRIPGLETASNRDLNVRWDESMKFDGLEAKFIGHVEAKLGQASMECEQMKLQLMERLAFQTVDADAKPAVRMIHCEQSVKFKNATYTEKKLIDKYRGEVSEFTWDHSTGEVVAQGPGEIQVWRRQKTAGTNFSPRDSIQANRPIPVEIPDWDYTRVQFEGKLRGRVDVELKGAFDPTIEDRVKVTHGPVPSCNEEVNPDKLPSKAGTIHCDRLQFVNHPVSDRNAVEFHELKIYGNAEVEGQVKGQRYTASADEINYDGSKGLFMLRGHGKQNARITKIGSGSIPGRRIEFNPATKYLRVERATDGQWSQP